METYYITGVQLGMLVALENDKEALKLVDEIIESQQIPNDRRGI